MMPHGSSLCGAVECRAGPDRHVTACHCTPCRKLSGHFSARFDAWDTDPVWDGRKSAEHVSAGGGRRGFCPGCGTKPFFWSADGSLPIEAGCIANPTGGHVTEHIFTAFKGDDH